MEKNSKPVKKFKGKKPKGKRKQPPRKFRCELCERIVIYHKHIKVRKNYPFGKKSKPQITYIHRQDGGCLVELTRKTRKDV